MALAIDSTSSSSSSSGGREYVQRWIEAKRRREREKMNSFFCHGWMHDSMRKSRASTRIQVTFSYIMPSQSFDREKQKENDCIHGRWRWWPCLLVSCHGYILLLCSRVKFDQRLFLGSPERTRHERQARPVDDRRVTAPRQTEWYETIVVEHYEREREYLNKFNGEIYLCSRLIILM